MTPQVSDSTADSRQSLPGSPNEIVLSCAAVSKSFATSGRQIQALLTIDLQVKRGIVTGLIGPDAAGKTTLMRLAAGLLHPDQGQLMVLGLDTVRDSLAIQSRIGYMPQRFGLYEDLSVRENLDLYADLHGIPSSARPSRYQELLRMTGLGAFTQRLAGRLSGGMKQKLGLACTLVRSPQLLLLDEPTVGVDPVSRRELWAIVYRLVRQEGMSVLLSTAYLDEAERCGEVILIHEGRILGTGSPGDFSARLTGQTYTVALPPDMRKRELQSRLNSARGVQDAVIQGEQVRVVMKPEADVFEAIRVATGGNAEVTTVPPRFEDSFITLINSNRTPQATPRTSLNASAVPNSDSPDAVIEVRDLQRRFGDFYAVRDLSFDVHRGEVFGLLGANGAGKTTTFRMLCGLLPASGGQLRVAGVDLRHSAAAARARIGYMSQKFSLYGNLSVRQNLNFFSGAYGLSGRRRAARMDWALSQFDLLPFATVESHTLPLGYKQRLALACALMHEPDTLFLDEPTSGVDPLARREFWQHINNLAQSEVTILVTTHFMEEAEYCDRLAIMAAGELLALGAPVEIKAQARDLERAEPTLEDAFIRLIETRGLEGNAA